MAKDDPKDDFFCSGLIKGDPDIAGVGVVAALWCTNALGVLISWILWYQRSVMRLEQVKSPALRATLKCAYLFGDTSLSTMLAVVCSSIILIKTSSETSLYHVFVARCLAQNCIPAIGSALYHDVEHGPNWRLRMSLLISMLILYLYWTSLCISEFNTWHSSSPRCFFDDSKVPFWYTTWMKVDLAWTPLGWMWYILETFSRAQPVATLLKQLNEMPMNASRSIQEQWNNMIQYARSPRSSASTLLAGLSLLVVFITIQVVVVLIIVLIFCPPSTEPITNSLYYIWSIYDLLTVWRANAHIIVECPENHSQTTLQGNSNPENDWGFGQLLPLFYLMLPLLNVFDIIAESL